jgi:uncharacterized protein
MMRISDVELRAPVRTPETASFWDAANEKRLLYAFCHNCKKPHYYPRRVCPFCFSTKVDFKDASGRAKVYAFSLFRKGQPPYVSAWIMLEEGVAIMSNITECQVDVLEIGTPVQVIFRAAIGGQLVPVFRPM